MSAPKSPTTTVEARRSRLSELLADGKTDAEAAQILRQEGYPASEITIRRDVSKLSEYWRSSNAESYDAVLARQQEELRDMRIVLTDPSFSPKERIVLALQILDREMELWGTKAPTKSIHANVGQGHQLDSLYLDIRAILLDESDQTKKAALELLRDFVKRRRATPQIEGATE